MLSRIEVNPIWLRVAHHFPIHTGMKQVWEVRFLFTLIKMTDTKIVFNGDTASGRAQWVPWLRSLALTLDEWAWSVLNNDVLPHGKVKKIMEKRPASRTDEEKEDLADTLEEACKGRDARKSKKSVSEWREEMSRDLGAFCTVIRDTERFLIQTLQSLTAGQHFKVALRSLVYAYNTRRQLCCLLMALVC